MRQRKELGQRSRYELAAAFGDIYSGWDRGVNVTQERSGDGETKFTETPMNAMELAARYVAAEIGLNIHVIASRAAFAPIVTYSNIQAHIGPVFAGLVQALETAIRVADEARAEWDKAPDGMKAGKLLIALSDPSLKYRADISEMHAALAAAKGEAMTTHSEKLGSGS